MDLTIRARLRTVWKRSKHKTSYRRAQRRGTCHGFFESMLHSLNLSYTQTVPIIERNRWFFSQICHCYRSLPLTTTTGLTLPKQGPSRLEIRYRIIMIRIETSTYNNGGFSCNKLQNTTHSLRHQATDSTWYIRDRRERRGHTYCFPSSPPSFFPTSQTISPLLMS